MWLLSLERMFVNHKQKNKQQRYAEKRKVRRYVIDFYLDDEEEIEIAEILDTAKKNKQLKLFIIKAVKKMKNI